MKKLLVPVYLFLFFSLMPAIAAEETIPTISVKNVLELEISSSINPATSSYLKTAIKDAERKNHDLIFIRLNTPGGLVSTTKEMIEEIGKATMPTVVWVGPEGASATSAGAIIASSAHALYMAPGSNIGAATPIQMGKDIDKESDMRQKAINDLAALVKSLSQARGRKTKPFEEMISDAKSFTAKEALEMQIIDGIASSPRELFEKLNGKEIVIQGVRKKLEVERPKVEDARMDWGQSLLNILANPSMAYILFLIGAALLYFELQAPGGMVAGAIGVICLVLAGIGFQVLPLHFGALGLIILSFILFVLEAFITSFGLLTLAGIVSLIAGSLFLYRGNDGFITVSTGVIASTVSAIGVFVLFTMFYLVKQWKQRKHTGFNDLVGSEARVMSIIDAEHGQTIEYTVKCRGEIWKAVSDKKYAVGDNVTIEKKEDDSLIVHI